SFTLAPSETRNVTVSFNPTSDGSKTATLSFDSNVPDENPLEVLLTGNGVIQDIDVSPLSLDFGSVLVSEMKTLSTIITNVGSKNLEVTGIQLGSSTSGDFTIDSAPGTPVTIPPSES
ncbi:choice-of-anchor D domain-containing protein, partial [candidate division KSB1 bacterium]|nr:choice-of-anchor D domain-containing protein [candidate division KSB1 bacterium]NIR73420.1 choice-of-anchor D domain-containing protein [candidate division KSB1 bacterium]NIS28411.1 choice-of-anchor D domain-containing protein [candidate division KSB1 bacterium]NIT75291.1 choice-of-anchor D domain-containing protein [candidate division KSB1 bacterium]NIU29139.1 choice-of-anchor D domain-containing protein [candidate division KSB1 bacterium]